MLIAIVVGLLVLAFIAYQVKGRLSDVGRSSTATPRPRSDRQRGHSRALTATDVTAKHNANIIDQTGAGVVASRISAEGDANIRNEAPRKNG